MSACRQPGDDRVALCCVVDHDARQPSVPAPPRRERHQRHPGHVSELLPVAVVDGQPPVDHLRQPSELSPADGREQVAEAVVEPHLDVLEVDGRLPGLRRQVAHAVGDRDVGGDEHPPPLVVAILLPLNENTPMSPSVPAARSPWVAPSASAASSTSATP